MTDFLQFTINGVLIGLLYAMIAVGFVVIFRAARIFNFAQGEIVMVGGFLIWWMISDLGLPPWLGLIGAFLTAGVMGILVERCFFRPIVGQPLFSLVMVTIGLLIFIRGMVLITWGAQPRPFPLIFPRNPVKMGTLIFDRALFCGGLTTIILVVGLTWFFARTKWGLRLTAVAEDHQVAQSLGISVKQAIGIAWALSGLLAALAAIFFLNGKMMSFLVSDVGMRAIPVALLAGVESIGGVIIAGIILGLAEAWVGAYLNPIVGTGMGDIVPFALMLFILLVKPTGFFGWQTIERL